MTQWDVLCGCFGYFVFLCTTIIFENTHSVFSEETADVAVAKGEM